MAKIIEGLWDCPYCGSKGIGGLKKHCPACGRPQDEGTSFYMPGEITYLNSNTASAYGKGEDWVCSYCDALNRYYAGNCVNCGAPREDGNGGYFDAHARAEEKKNAGSTIEQTPHPKKKTSLLPFLFIIAAIIALFAFFNVPRQSTATVTDTSWSRVITLEQYVTEQESGWYAPSEARVYAQQEEIQRYEEVLDHYQSVPVEYSREVLDHYETETTYTNNGDGTYTENSYSVPVYTTEYYTVMEEQPVYRSEPVYATKYYYEIDRWVTGRSITTSGHDKAVAWGDSSLKDNEREAYRSESYSVTLSTAKGNTYTIGISSALWNTLETGATVEVTISGGRITAINGQTIT